MPVVWALHLNKVRFRVNTPTRYKWSPWNSGIITYPVPLLVLFRVSVYFECCLIMYSLPTVQLKISCFTALSCVLCWCCNFVLVEAEFQCHCFLRWRLNITSARFLPFSVIWAGWFWPLRVCHTGFLFFCISCSCRLAIMRKEGKYMCGPPFS